MKLMDKVLGFIGFEEVPEDFEEKNLEERPHETPEEFIKPKRKGQVLNLHTHQAVKVVVAKPQTFEETQELANHLKNRRPIIINLEKTNAEVAKRIVDFMCGTAYALNGNMQRVGNGIFLFVPSNIEINSEFKEQIKEGELFSWMKVQ
ncbi:MAG TPA: cell division protein SepF [Desulfotomaculum sp.]|nr:cell division protein SepF [Desulfotomaculum sp.]